MLNDKAEKHFVVAVYHDLKITYGMLPELPWWWLGRGNHHQARTTETKS